MGQKIAEVSRNIKKSMRDPQRRKAWQIGIGISTLALFVLSTVVVNNTLQAANLAIGNYGYYGGTYGYNTTTTSSDAAPAAPTALSCSTGSNSATCSWTAPTMTTDATAIATGGGSVASYNISYNTSAAPSSCTAATATTSSTASVTLASLTSGTTYFIGVCAVDNNGNSSAILTGSFAVGTSSTASGSTGGGGGVSSGTVSGEIVTVAPDVSSTPAGPGVTVAPAPATVVTQVQNSATEFGVTLSATDLAAAANFVNSGTTAATVRLGSGERLALVRDQLETLGRISVLALEQLAAGQKPTVRSLSKEQSQLPKVLAAFEKVFGRRPNFRNAADDLRWNTLMYRVRFPRDLAKERTGIARFKVVFGRIPTSPLDWAVVRAIGYVR